MMNYAAEPYHQKTVINELRRLLGARMSTAEDVRERHAKDASYHPPHRPDAVVFPHSNEEVSQIVLLCAHHRVPIVPFGTGTAVEGGVVAIHGGICIDLSQMNRILRVSVSDMDATVQAGVTRQQLNRYLAETETGLHFPVD
ncbi:FAD-binding protein, partial [Candidatus Poribacteria bacterium]|nr:FAD-binding protein [Candidatus Poribacteria bacterium]